MKRELLAAIGLGMMIAATGCRGAETADPVAERGTASQAQAPEPDRATPAGPQTVEGGSTGTAGSAGAPAAAPGAPGAAGQAGGTPGAPAPSAAPAGQVSAPAATAPDAAAVLRRAEQSYAGVRAMQAEFSQEVNVPLLGQSTRSRGTLYHRRPDRFLMRFSDPQGDVVVADGRHLWMYHPSVDPRQVMRTTMAAGGQQVDLHQEFLSNPTERFNAVLQGTETVGGRATDLVVLTPRTRSGYRQVRLWIDREDALVRRFEITEENESVRTLELRDIRRNPTLGDDLFAFTPPAGAQIYEQ